MWARSGSGRMLSIACLATLMAFSAPGSVIAGQVRGTVIDREGKPAAGAKVRAAKLGFMERLDAREGVADDSGAFAIEVGDGDWIVFALRGDEGGRAGWRSIAKVGEGKKPEPVTVRLGPPTKLKGRLLDAETGEPIPGGRFALNDARRLEVDAQGRFEASGLEMTHHEAYPLCPGYERKRILFDTTGRPDAELELKLPRAGKVVGRVLDGDGKPIAGATVGLRTSGSIFSGSALWEKCSEDGRFSYEGKPLGRTGRLSARAPGYQDQEREDVVALDASVPAEFNFTLRPDPRQSPAAKTVARDLNRRTVSGTVVGPEGKPVAQAVVRWGLVVSSDSVPETKTDAKGAFRLEAVPDDSNVLSVMAKGLTPSFPMVDAGGDRQVSVELKPGATIRGRVVDDAGAPIEGVMVVPQVNNPRPNWGGFVYLDELEARTDRDGRFHLEGLPENVRFDIVDESHSAVRQKTLSTTDESKNVVVLLGGGAIRGRVVGPLGNPIKNFRVQVGIPKGAKPGDPVGGYFAGYSGTGLAFTPRRRRVHDQRVDRRPPPQADGDHRGLRRRRGRPRRGPVARAAEPGRRPDDQAGCRTCPAGPRVPEGGQAGRGSPGDRDPERGSRRVPLGLQRKFLGRQRRGAGQRAGLGRIPLAGLRQGHHRREGQGLCAGEARLGERRGGIRRLPGARGEADGDGPRRLGKAGRRSEDHAVLGTGRDDERAR